MAEKFTPIFNLDDLNKEQRQDYYLSACKHFGVPPELNVLRLQYIDSNDGARSLVLCATKGATDIIRGNRGISVTNLSDKIIGGSLVFTATGQDKQGRTEMSTGSAYIDGLKGQALDNAIMTAQTRALKRMTLQFAGGGIMDESELPQATTTPLYKAASVAQAAAQPSVVPNPAPGREATEITGDPARDFPKDARLMPTKAQLEAQKALTSVKPEVLAKAVGEVLTTPVICDPGLPSVQQNPSNEGVSSQEISEPKRRKRATFNKPFSLEPVTSAVAETPGLIENWKSHPEHCTVTISPEPKPEPVLTPVMETAIRQTLTEAPKNVIPLNVPDPVKLNELRNKLFKYNNEILPKAGLVSDEGAPAAMKVRRFVIARYKNPSLNQLTVEQWEDLYSYMDSVIQEKGATELVQIINSVVENV